MSATGSIQHVSREARRHLDATRYRIAARPSRWRPERRIENPNTIFSRTRCDEVEGHVQRMAHRDPHLLQRVAEARLKGVRAWEYGTLLGALARYPARRSWLGLDVGSGNSTFPLYLVESGNVGSMVAVDLEQAHEAQTERNRSRERSGGVERVVGSMLELPFDSNRFDLVTCISAIEHLDGNPHVDSNLPYDDYVDRTRRALVEMMRILRPGGHLYVTTDAYIPELQTTDRWSSPRGRGPIWSAYHYGDIGRVFLATLEREGGRLVGEADYRPELLEKSPSRANYRGRYFTTFCVLAEKTGSGERQA